MIGEIRVIHVPRFHDVRGTLSVVENLPFAIQRAYYLYDIPSGESQRGGHAHLECHRVIFALAGSFTAHLEREKKIVAKLELPWIGIEVPPLTWLELRDFSAGSVCLVLASHVYDADDYIRDRREWEIRVTNSILMEKP